jgi:hypothetical protein
MRSSRVVVFGLVAALGGAGGVFAQEGGDPDVTGTVVSSTTGDPISGVWIQLVENGDFSTYSWNDGHFLIPGAPAGPHDYTFHALAYHDATVTIDASAGDRRVELTPDPVLLDRLNALDKQLEGRRNRTRRPVVFDRADLAFDMERLSSRAEWTLARFLQRHRLEQPSIVCLNEAPGGAFALEEEPQSFYLVEALDHGRVLRIYTEDFVRSLIMRGKDLGAKATLPYTC